MTANVLKFNNPVRLAKLAADPVGGENGMLYYNTALGFSRTFENGTWVNVASREYVQAVQAGLDPKEAVLVATTANLAAVYANGTAGVGATLTATGNGVMGPIDGIALAVNDRVLVKNQTTLSQNGFYTVTSLGSAGAPWVLTRSVDFDGSPSSEINGGEYTFVKTGTVNAGGGYVLLGLTGPAVLGTSPLAFTQFSAAASTLQTAYNAQSAGNPSITTNSTSGSVEITGSQPTRITQSSNQNEALVVTSNSSSGPALRILHGSTSGNALVIASTAGTSTPVASITQSGTSTGEAFRIDSTGGAGTAFRVTSAATNVNGPTATFTQTGNTAGALLVQATGGASGVTAALFTQAAANSSVMALISPNTGVTGPATLVLSRTGGSSGSSTALIDIQGSTSAIPAMASNQTDLVLHAGKTGQSTVASNNLLVISNVAQRGKSAASLIDEEYVHAQTLTASSTAVTLATLNFAFATFVGAQIDYTIKEATSNAVRVGTLMVATDGAITSVTDNYSETGEVGVLWTSVINGANVELKYTTTANNKTMNADVKRFRA